MNFPFPIGATLRRPDGALGVVRKIQHVDHADADYGTIEWLSGDAGTSFSAPQDVSSWRQESGLTFSVALELLKSGKRVARSGWNGKGMWLALWTAGTYDVTSETLENCQALIDLANAARSRSIDVGASIVMKTADGSVVFGWLASQTDMLSEDYEVVP